MSGADELDDPDRAAILARRRRFIALAISGLATTACKRAPEVCLSIAAPEDDEWDHEPPADGGDKPFVEDPGAPLETGETETGEPEQVETPQTEPAPRPCLNVHQPRPQPCLEVKKPPPQPCLLIID